MITKQDYAIGALVGFMAGIFALPTLINLGLRELGILALVPLVVPPLFVLGIWLTKFLSRWLAVMAQFGKFAAVGFLNTAIDFGVLNILSMITGVTAGFVLGGVNIPGFILAVSNAYFWNKFWVFRDREGGVLSDFPKFLAVSLLGLLINSGTVVVLTTYLPLLLGLAGATWLLNIAKVIATVVSLAWNFFGYKFLVFRSTERFPRYIASQGRSSSS